MIKKLLATLFPSRLPPPPPPAPPPEPPSMKVTRYFAAYTRVSKEYLNSAFVTEPGNAMFDFYGTIEEPEHFERVVRYIESKLPPRPVSQVIISNIIPLKTWNQPLNNSQPAH